MPRWLKITEQPRELKTAEDLLRQVVITKEVLVEIDSTVVDPDDVDEDKLVVKPGRYAIDNLGRVWQYMPDVSDLFAVFGVDDPQIRADRGAARRRVLGKKKPKKEKA